MNFGGEDHFFLAFDKKNTGLAAKDLGREQSTWELRQFMNEGRVFQGNHGILNRQQHVVVECFRRTLQAYRLISSESGLLVHAPAGAPDPAFLRPPRDHLPEVCPGLLLPPSRGRAGTPA